MALLRDFLADDLRAGFSYVALNREPYIDWVLREKAEKTTNMITDIVSEHMKRLSGQSVVSLPCLFFVQCFKNTFA